jgi:hypothetical protein
LKQLRAPRVLSQRIIQVLFLRCQVPQRQVNVRQQQTVFVLAMLRAAALDLL